MNFKDKGIKRSISFHYYFDVWFMDTNHYKLRSEIKAEQVSESLQHKKNCPIRMYL